MEEKLLKALQTIKEECENNPNCKMCPMRVKNIDNDEYMCYLRTRNPLCWSFKHQVPQEVPRIFGD